MNGKDIECVAPKSLRDPVAQARRVAALHAPHIAPLTEFVEALRAEVGPDYSIPYFDPFDGGTVATLLYLLEAPGPKAVASGFVSRDNPDETAKNFLLLNQEAGIDRRTSVVWNIVPWYLGDGARIRAAGVRDTAAGAGSLERLFGLLPRVRCIALLGKHAAKAEPLIRGIRPAATIVSVPHPSPMFVNRAPGNRERLLAGFRDVAARMG